jgi:hypothetical protein
VLEGQEMVRVQLTWRWRLQQYEDGRVVFVHPEPDSPAVTEEFNARHPSPSCYQLKSA